MPRRRRATPPPAETSTDTAQSLGSGSRELGRAIKKWCFVPDDRVLWAPFAVPRALRAIKKQGIAVIWATTPCYSSGVIGQILSRISRLPLVLDLRDPWSRDPYLPSPTWLHAWLNSKLEATSIARASRVIVISEQMRKRFRDTYPRQPGEKFVTITNGHDAEEIAATEPADTGGRFGRGLFGLAVRSPPAGAPGLLRCLDGAGSARPGVRRLLRAVARG